MQKSVSSVLTQLLRVHGVRTVFGVPGAYSIDLNDKLEQAGVRYVLASNEAGAAFMSQAYAQVSATAGSHTRGKYADGIGCLISTAGPGALNAITGLVSARADGDTVLIIHGSVPKAQLGRGALQDLHDLLGAPNVLMGRITRQSFPVDDVSEFEGALRALEEQMARRPGKEGPLHFPIKMNVFPCPTTTEVRSLEPPPNPDREEATNFARQALEMLRVAKKPVVLVGHGAYRANRILLTSTLEKLSLCTMTTARGVAIINCDSPVLVGQHSIFPSPRAVALLEQKPDLLVAIGTSLGEFSSNSWSPLLSDIPNVVHVNVDAKCFGRLKQPQGSRVDALCDVTLFLECLNAELTADDCRRISAASLPLLQAVKAANVASVSRGELLTDENTLSGQAVAYRVGQALRAAVGDERVVNIVADTGSSKLYAAHYMNYPKNWRCLMNSGTIDCLGYALPASIGAAVASRDHNEEGAVTVCLVGDGGALMNMELNALNANASLSELSLIFFVLNDGALAYVDQGFLAVMERPLNATRFSHRVDFSKLASAFNMHSVVVTKPTDITEKFMKDLIDMHRPVLVDCRLEPGVFGPGLERYQRVRSLLGKPKLRDDQIQNLGKRSYSTHRRPSIQSHPNDSGEVFTTGRASGGSNRLHLYGIIYDVFRGCIVPARDCQPVQPELKFGLGVSSFNDDLSDIGDAVYFDGRFFVRKTLAGEARFPEGGKKFKEGTSRTYRTVYSLGITQNPLDMSNVELVADDRCAGKKTMRDMLTSFIGAPRTGPEDRNRIFGFCGLVEYHHFLGTSLSHAPTKGENILPVIESYARPSVPLSGRSGMVMGFVRTVADAGDSATSKRLYERMFYTNPRDNDTGSGMKESASTDFGTFWISHTHGMLLEPGDSVFSRHSIPSLVGDSNLLRKTIQHKAHAKVEDCGHVIPGSTLAKYLFVKFPIHHVDVYNPSPQNDKLQ